MYLHEFIKTYIARNTLVRLWRPIDTNKPYREKILLTNKAVMEWEVMDIPQLHDIPVIHITDIVCDTEKEAVNIVVGTTYKPEDVISMIDEYRKIRRKENLKIRVSEGRCI